MDVLCYLRLLRWVENTCIFYILILLSTISQEEIVAETDPENFGEEVAAAKRTLENLNKSLRMNDGQFEPKTIH